jgi:hypothetical protein
MFQLILGFIFLQFFFPFILSSHLYGEDWFMPYQYFGPIHNVTANLYYNISANNSVCILPSGKQLFGPSICSTGDVIFIGKYVLLGINNIGTLGTNAHIDSQFLQDRLGMVVDFDKNGWLSLPSPSRTTDYILPGLPIESISNLLIPFQPLNLSFPSQLGCFSTLVPME